ncbi:MAG: nucleoside triphosphate pyrophosphohydrolase family protein [Alphaproteobacteria bacterium]|nr:nucleoside triphosphate pyrophosphohydrolase family protein [Alphaproteobacteria bacterium]
MAKYEDAVRAFHKAMGLPLNAPFSADLLAFRRRLIVEETDELLAELDTAAAQIAAGEKVSRAVFENICKEMADVMYITCGLAVSFGLPVEAAFDATHASNMSKLGPDGKPVYRADGKVLKGPGYRAPDLSALTQEVEE